MKGARALGEVPASGDRWFPRDGRSRPLSAFLRHGAAGAGVEGAGGEWMVGGGGCRPNAPESEPAACGRAIPRWSVTATGGVHRAVFEPGMRLIAELEAASARVGVGPPLSASACSAGS